MTAVAVLAGVLPSQAWAAPAYSRAPGSTVYGSLTQPTQRSGSAAGVPDEVSADGEDVPTRSLPRPDSAVGPEQQFPDPGEGGTAGPSVQSVSLSQTPQTSTGVVAGSRELTSERTGNSTVFENPDGTKTLRMFDEPAFVPDASGVMVPVDARLANKSGRLAPKAAGPVSLAASSGDPVLARVDPDKGISIGYGLADAAAVDGQVDGATVTYPGVRKDAALSLLTGTWGIKETLTLSSPDAPSSWLFPLRLKGVTPRANTDTGAVEFVDDGGVVRAVVPSGWMEDANLDPRSGQGAHSDGVATTLVHDTDGSWALRVDLDQKWLASPDRVYPVTVDPTMLAAASTSTAFDPTSDTFVMSPYNNDNSADSELKVGTFNGGGNKAASYLRFNALTQDLQNHYILGGSLNLYETWSYSCTARPMTVYRVTQSGWSVGEAKTWPGPSYDSKHPVVSKSFAHASTGCGADWESLTISADRLMKWAHHVEPFYGFTLRASSTDTKAWKRFASANAPIANNKPHLDVNYADQGAAYSLPHNYFSPPVTGTTAGKITVRVTNWGTSTWTSSNGYKLGYTVLNSSGTTVKSGTFTIPKSTGPHHSVDVIAAVGPLDPGSYSVRFDMVNPSGQKFSAQYGAPYGTASFSVANTPPTTTANWPANNGSTSSLRPTLWAKYFDPDDYPAGKHQLSFTVCTGTADKPTNCQNSGWVNTASWTPPNPVGTWGTPAVWWVQASDTTTQGAKVGPLYYTPALAQPEITSHLSSAGADADTPGLDPEAGNYSTSATDASVAAVGPDLAITRTYNSQDARTDGAFGAGWHSTLDQRIQADPDSSGNMLLTLSSGRQLRFGKNTDGTYSPPSGQSLTLVHGTSPETWTLRDATGTRTVFDAAGKLSTVTDAAGNSQILGYGADGTLATVIDAASGRALHLTWTGAHVTSVATDAPEDGAAAPTWTYTYDGDLLSSVCTPLSADSCTHYTYQGSSHYRSVVTDDNPTGYWPLADQAGEDGQAPDTADNVVAADDDTDAGEYDQVTVGAAGPLSGTTQTGVTFGGGSMQTADDLLTKSASNTIELWFKAASGQAGVLFGEQDTDVGDTPSHNTPDIYVGTDGLLYGWFWSANCSGCQMHTTSRVDDGAWHHVVLSSEVDKQQLYLDGAQIGTDNGHIPDHTDTAYSFVGRSYVNDRWAATTAGYFGFGGQIAQVAVYHHPLSAGQVAAHYAARAATSRLATVTEPGNITTATVTYDDGSGRVATVADRNGATWTLSTPRNAESVRSIELQRTDRATITYSYDLKHNGRLTDRDDGDDTGHWDYNASGFSDTYTDPAGHQYVDYTDDRGNVVEHGVWRNGDWRYVKYGYYLNTADPLDARNDQVTYVTDPRFNTAYILRRSYTLDTAGRPTRITYPRQAAGTSNPSETFTYATGTEPADGGGTVPPGLLLTHVGLRNQTTTYTYNAKGDRTSTTEASGLVTTDSHDALGRVISTTRLDGTTTLPGGGGHPDYGTVERTWTPTGLPDTVTGPATSNAITGTVHTPKTTYAYNAAGQPTTVAVSDTTGGDATRTTTYGYDTRGRLASTTDPAKQTTSQVWNTAGDVASVTLPGGLVKEMGYNDRHQLVQTDTVGDGVDPADPQATRLTLESRGYDPAGELTVVTDAQGRETDYTYFGDGSPATDIRKNVTQADGSSHDVVLADRTYDAAGNLVQNITAGNVVHQYAYDTTGDQLRDILDPGGLSTAHSYTYDADGDPLTDTLTRSIAYVPGTSIEAKYLSANSGSTIDPQQRRVADGTATFTYKIPLPTGASASNGTVHVDVDNQYKVQAGTDGTTWPYAKTGSATDGSNYTDLAIPTSGLGSGDSIYIKVSDATSSDGFGARVTGVTLDLGAGDQTRSTTYTYNPAGQPLTATVDNPGGSPSSLTARTDYDPRGLPTTVTDPNGNTTTLGYDEADRQTTTTGAARTTWLAGTSTDNTKPVTTTGYDSFGGATHQRDPNGHTTVTTYDSDGRPRHVTQPDYTTPGGVTLTATTDLTYTAAGQPATVTDPLQRTTSYGYDIYGRQTSITQPDPDVADGPDGPVTSLGYDRDGELISTTDPTGAVSSATYDELGRPITATQAERVPSGGTRYFTTRTGYDDASNPVTVTTPAGHTTTNTYDKAGQLTHTLDAAGHYLDYTYTLDGQLDSANDQDTRYTAYTYDRAGRLTGVDQPYSSVATGAMQPRTAESSRDWTYRYDGNGNLLRAVTPEGRETSYGYDPDGHRTTVTQYVKNLDPDSTGYDPTDPGDPATAITVQLGYDPAGNQTRMVDGNQHTTLYTFTAWDQPESTIEPATAQHPDAVDRTWTTTYDAAGQSVHDQIPGGITRDRTYDFDGRLTDETGSGTATAPRHLGYDQDGRLASVSGPGADTTYEYNDRGLLTATHAPTGEAAFTYDDDSNQATATTTAGTATFGYDDADRLATAADPLTGATIGYTYWPTGELKDQTYRTGGATRTYTYDDLGRLATDTIAAPTGSATASIAYGYDLDDNLTTKTTTGYAVPGTNTYGYDQLSRLTSWTNPENINRSYGYDGASNRTTDTSPDGTRTNTYNARNELTSATGTSTPDLTQTYTPRGTLATATTGTTTTTYTNDAFDRLVGTTTGTTTVTNTYDGLDRLVTRNGASLAYADQTNDTSAVPQDGGQSTAVVRLPDGAPVSSHQTGGGSPSTTLISDQHDDLVAAIDPATGNPAASTAYTPDGVPTRAGGSLALGYQSGYTDPNTGLVNAAARWYDPNTARFTTRDTWNLAPDPTPQTNHYTYANAEPLNATDANGHNCNPCGHGGGGGNTDCRASSSGCGGDKGCISVVFSGGSCGLTSGLGHVPTSGWEHNPGNSTGGGYGDYEGAGSSGSSGGHAAGAAPDPSIALHDHYEHTTKDRGGVHAGSQRGRSTNLADGGLSNALSDDAPEATITECVEAFCLAETPVHGRKSTQPENPACGMIYCVGQAKTQTAFSGCGWSLDCKSGSLDLGKYFVPGTPPGCYVGTSGAGCKSVKDLMDRVGVDEYEITKDHDFRACITGGLGGGLPSALAGPEAVGLGFIAGCLVAILAKHWS
ncbi:MAG TPA: LamG-like jellyroll fold domain-containing protein [Actinocatenispora sp.]